MATESNLSYTSALILLTIAGGARYGFEIMDVTGLPSGTVYPALRRMEKAELIASRWEAEERAFEEGRPARKYYETAEAGRAALDKALARYPLLRQMAASRG